MIDFTSTVNRNNKFYLLSLILGVEECLIVKAKEEQDTNLLIAHDELQSFTIQMRDQPIYKSFMQEAYTAKYSD